MATAAYFRTVQQDAYAAPRRFDSLCR